MNEGMGSSRWLEPFVVLLLLLLLDPAALTFCGSAAFACWRLVSRLDEDGREGKRYAVLLLIPRR